MAIEEEQMDNGKNNKKILLVAVIVFTVIVIFGILVINHFSAAGRTNPDAAEEDASPTISEVSENQDAAAEQKPETVVSDPEQEPETSDAIADETSSSEDVAFNTSVYDSTIEVKNIDCYAFVDLDNNGIEEMIAGYNQSGNMQILNIYSYKDGSVIQYNRSSDLLVEFILSDGRIIITDFISTDVMIYAETTINYEDECLDYLATYMRVMNLEGMLADENASPYKYFINRDDDFGLLKKYLSEVEFPPGEEITYEQFEQWYENCERNSININWITR